MTQEEHIKQEEWHEIIVDILHVHSHWSPGACDRIIPLSKFKQAAWDILEQMKELIEETK